MWDESTFNQVKIKGDWRVSTIVIQHLMPVFNAVFCIIKRAIKYEPLKVFFNHYCPKNIDDYLSKIWDIKLPYLATSKPVVQ